jgi:hypothetical protein
VTAYQARPIRRTRATKAEVELSAPETKAGRLQRACLALLKQHEREGTIPTNGRFLFYELEQQGVVPKAYRDASGKERARTPAQDISDATMRLRNVGPVPWDWILDESRDVTTWRYAGSVYEYVANSVERARIDCWDGEPPPLIICEARATRGVLERTVVAEYLCPITATGGQCGGHIVTEIVPLLKNNERKVLYIGDCEERGPGDQIEANTRRYIEKHAKRTFTPETWIKVALTPEQVARSPRLRRLTINKVDHRYRPPRPYKAIECEAVGQAVLERMLRKVLDALLPEPLERVRVREQRQRTKVRTALTKLGRRR